VKSFRYFTEYVNASTPAFAVGGASTGPGMGQYSPVADLNAQKKKQRRTKQDPDIKDSPGTEPAKYYAKDASGKGMAKSTKQARDRHFTKGAAKDDDDPSAYKPAPGDKGAKTKLSKHTQKYRKMYGEDGHTAIAKTNTSQKKELEKLKIQHDREDDRARAQDTARKNQETESLWDNIRKKKERIKKGSGEKMRKPGEKGAPTPAQIQRAQEDFELNEKRAKQAVAGGKVQKLVTAHGLKFKGKVYKEIDMELVKIDNSTQTVTFNIIHPKEIFGNEVKLSFKVLKRGPFMATDTSKIKEDFELNEKIEGLVKKSEKSGIAYGILKKVYSRGMAAWKTGHRPGTTPQQWAFARVNSFITGGGARKSDADLWRQHKGK
tara:strand:+ start:899 stop:2029 length:1131 start_codon:yes stop_codon:yes gene_type:complete